MSSAPPPDDFTGRAKLVGTAVERWQQELQQRHGANTLLWYAEGGSGWEVTTAHPAGVARLFSTGRARVSDLARTPAAYETARGKAATLAHAVDTEAASNGTRSLFLAVGLARWRFPGAGRMACAPVLLHRARISGLGWHTDDFVVEFDRDRQVNPALVRSLAVEHGIDLDTEQIIHLAAQGSGADPRAAFDALRRACAQVPGFTVESRHLLEVFTWDKLSAVSDLPGQGQDLVTHEVIAALAGVPEAIEQVRAVPPPFTEQPIAGEMLVADATAEQQEVVEAVRAGAQLVVDGAPGTGKSRTAIDIAAGLVADGRRTLFVSANRAALDGFVDAWRAAGLQELLLDARDGIPDGHEVGEQVLQALATPPVGADPDREADADSDRDADADADRDADADAEAAADRLSAYRDGLAAHWSAMHAEREPWGITLDQAQTAVSRLSTLRPPPHSRLRLQGAELASMTLSRRDQLIDSLVQVARDGAWTTSGRPDPWFGAQIVGDHQRARVAHLVDGLAGGGLDQHRERMDELFESCGLPAASSVRAEEEALELLGDVHATLEVFRPEVFSASLSDMVVATGSRHYRKDSGSSLGLLERRRLTGQAEELLRPGPRPADLHGVLKLAAAQRQTWRALAGKGSRPSAPPGVLDAVARHERLREQLTWLGERLAGTREGGDLLDEPFEQLQARLKQLADAADRLPALVAVGARVDTLREAGWGPLLDELAAHQVPADRVRGEAEFVWWTSVLADIEQHDRRYSDHDGVALRQLASRYCRADRQHLATGGERVLRAAARHRAMVASDLPEQVSELDRLVGEGEPELGDLLAAAPEAVTAARPVWVCSVRSVAELVPPGSWFDVVIVDEAAAVPTCETISALSRAGQVVAIGSPAHGIPGSLAADLSRQVPVQTLRWDLRSRDERLVTLVNARLYAGEVATLPGPVATPAVRLDVVSNTTSAQRVAELVVEHAHRGQGSLAVVALDEGQAQAVEAAVRQQLKGQHDLAARLDGPEPFAVWTPLTARGQERDAIIVAVGSGIRAVLGHDAGEIALATALTRARSTVVTVSTVSAEDLKDATVRSRGMSLLRDHLRYAAGGGSLRRVSVPGTSPTGRRRRTASSGSVLDRPLTDEAVGPEPNPLVTDLISRLAHDGVIGHPDAGTSSERIDLVLDDPRRPGTPKVAVLTDGAAYGRMAATRNRERLLPERLEAMGWIVERVWTRDLFRDPAREVARLVQVAFHDPTAQPAEDSDTTSHG